MPLIVMCGLPCSGKSMRAQVLKEYFDKTYKTELITEGHVGMQLNKNSVFSDSTKEKELRSSLKSEVQKHISRDTVVILDSANYVKGYRYELYCLSKGSKTTHCVVHCDLLPEDCMSFNQLLPEDLQYNREVFDGLVQRFEAPESRNRWDSPLFTIHKDEELSLKDIDDAIFLRKAPPPNLATQTAPLQSTNFLYELDRVTQDIIKVIINAQKTHTIGDYIMVPPTQQKICLSSSVSAAELTRTRRQFITYAKLHSNITADAIPDLFVQYLAKRL